MKTYHSIEGTHGKVMMADLHMPYDQALKSLVVYCHGINGFKDWGGLDLIAQAFARRGHAFFKFNFSHNGTTPEHPEEFRDLEAYGNDNYLTRQQDLKAVMDYVSQLEPLKHIRDITLTGHSRGGTDVILYAPEDSRIDRIITWAAVSEAKTPWRNWLPAELNEWRENSVRFLKNSRTGQELPIYYQLYEEYQVNSSRLDVERAARKIEIPWLIIHGSEDESVFIKDAYSLKEWYSKAEVVIVPHTGHTFDRSHPWTSSELPEASKALVEKSLAFIEKVPQRY